MIQEQFDLTTGSWKKTHVSDFPDGRLGPVSRSPGRAGLIWALYEWQTIGGGIGKHYGVKED